MIRMATALLSLLGFSLKVLAHDFVWNADTLPQDGGWQIESIGCDPHLWLQDGWFYGHMDLCPEYPPPGGDAANYRRSINEYVGAPDFYIEFRVECDSPQSDLFPWGGGADVGTGGHGPTTYVWSIVSDRVWLLRSNSLPNVFVDIAPGVPHTYRLELRGAQNYTWLIDGAVVDSGVPEGAYPADEPAVVFNLRMGFTPDTSRWDYIRYGRIPHLGDLNCDGLVNDFDIDPFVIALTNPAEYGAAFPTCSVQNADVNQDGGVNNFDIDPFVELLIGG